MLRWSAFNMESNPVLLYSSLLSLLFVLSLTRAPLTICGAVVRHDSEAQTPSPSAATGNPLLGINYGRVGNNLPSHSEAVSLIKSLGIGRVRIYDVEPTVLSALTNTGLEVVVTVKNEELYSVASSRTAAYQWVGTNVAAFMPATDIAFINVGNEILSGNDTRLWQMLVPAVTNIHFALFQHGLNDKVKVTTSSAMDVLKLSYPPTAGAFRDDIANTVMKPLLAFLTQTKTPFFLNVYPYLTWSSNTDVIPLSYALFNATSMPTILDNDLAYYNLLDAQLDAVAFAMARLGFPGVELVVSETGWPTAGDANQPGASPANALMYNTRLADKVLAVPNEGTPLRPGIAVPTFIFALFNENEKGGPTTECNWGIFYPNGTQVYPFSIEVPSPTGSPAPSPSTGAAVSPAPTAAGLSPTNAPSPSFSPAPSPSSTASSPAPSPTTGGDFSPASSPANRENGRPTQSPSLAPVPDTEDPDDGAFSPTVTPGPGPSSSPAAPRHQSPWFHGFSLVVATFLFI